MRKSLPSTSQSSCCWKGLAHRRTSQLGRGWGCSHPLGKTSPQGKCHKWGKCARRQGCQMCPLHKGPNSCCYFVECFDYPNGPQRTYRCKWVRRGPKQRQSSPPGKWWDPPSLAYNNTPRGTSLEVKNWRDNKTLQGTAAATRTQVDSRSPPGKRWSRAPHHHYNYPRGRASKRTRCSPQCH